MTEEPKLSKEQEKKVAELMLRRQIARLGVQTCADNPEHPGAKESEQYYRGQLRSLDQAIADITGRPPDITVGLKTGSLFGRAQLTKE